MAIDVTDAIFEKEVVQESFSRPVLVDFWAEWCGPCRMIGPVLEKLENEMQGKFLLAKLDTDRNQATAVRFGIQSIPAVKLFHKGQVIDEFMGALPEARVREFLERSIPDEAMTELLSLSEHDPIEAAKHVLESGMEARGSSELLWNGALDVIRKDLEQRNLAQSFLEKIPEHGNERSDARRWLLSYLQSSASESGWSALVDVVTPGKEEEGLRVLLESVIDSRGDDRLEARNGLLAAFQILGNNSELANQYRRKLSSYLYE